MGFNCRRCGACCNSYWITMLPGERAAMARELKISEKQFTDKYSILLLQLFPAPLMKQKALLVPAKKLPKKIFSKIKKQLKEPPECFVALPSIAFKRGKGVCVLFDRKKSACLVHGSKPGQCTLFPFISLGEEPDFCSLYGFCAGLKNWQGAPAGWKERVAAHYANFSKYLESVQENGFRRVWGHWPKSGMLLLKNKECCKISKKDFFAIISLFPQDC